MCNYEGFCACTSLCNYNIKVYSFPLSVSSRDAFNSVWFIKGCFGQMALAFFISTSEVAVNFTKVFWNYFNFTYNNVSYLGFLHCMVAHTSIKYISCKPLKYVKSNIYVYYVRSARYLPLTTDRILFWYFVSAMYVTRSVYSY